MVLPLLFSWLAPQLLGLTGTGALAASAVAGGVGAAAQGDDFMSGMAQGLLPGLMGGGGGGLADLLGTGASGSASTAAALQPGQMAVGSGNAAATALAPGSAGITGVPIEGLMPPVAAAAETPGFFSGLMNSPGKMALLAGGAAALGPLINGADDAPEKYKSDRDPKQEAQPLPRIAQMPTLNDPGAGTREFDYGISTPQTATAINDYTKLRYAADGGMISRFANPNIPGRGPIRLAQGGIVALARGGPVPEGQPNEHDIAMAAEQVIRSGDDKSPRAMAIITAYVQTFGQDALMDLVAKIESGAMPESTEALNNGEGGEAVGPADGSGKDDKVAVTLNNGEDPVMLTDGEFVFQNSAAKAIGADKLEAINSAGPQAAEVAKKVLATA